MKFYDLISSFFYSGKVKYAPGTFASFLTAIIIFLISYFFPQIIIFIIIGIFIVIIGTITSNISEKKCGVIDPGWIVIDEVAGMFICVFFVPFNDYILIERIVFILIAFGLFRFFDILKPSPIRQIQKLKGGFGIMADDIVAGIFSNLVTRVLFAFIFNKVG